MINYWYFFKILIILLSCKISYMNQYEVKWQRYEDNESTSIPKSERVPDDAAPLHHENNKKDHTQDYAPRNEEAQDDATSLHKKERVQDDDFSLPKTEDGIPRLHKKEYVPDDIPHLPEEKNTSDETHKTKHHKKYDEPLHHEAKIKHGHQNEEEFSFITYNKNPVRVPRFNETNDGSGKNKAGDSLLDARNETMTQVIDKPAVIQEEHSKIHRPRHGHGHRGPKILPLSSYNWTVWCKLQPNGYNCDDFKPRTKKYYYDIRLQRCGSYEFGSCHNNFNKFDHRTSCSEICESSAGGYELQEHGLPPNVACLLQPALGSCNEYYPGYYYDVTERKCLAFSYTGCNGNANRFKTYDECDKKCSNVSDVAKAK